MKCSKVMAVLCCGALALAVTGCKYDNANDDDVTGGGTQEVVTDGADDQMNANAKDISTDDTANANAEEMDLSAATGLPFDQDPNYARCTDVDFAPVYFGFDASQLAPAELSKIEAVAQHLQTKTDRVVIIEGNCDERGSNEYNMALGENRASIIRNYLVQSGVDASRIQTRSFGEEKPAVVGSDESAWAKNRRGEFVIYQK